MKYIRTENGIYAFKEEMEIKIFYLNYSEGKPYLIFDDKKTRYDILGKVIEQADTIEELCDSIVETCISGNRVYDICEFDDMFKNMAIQKIYTNIAVNLNYKCFYGAIWTNKGLIYVAKMNNEGVLELI